ncbi:LexA family protein [Aeromonas veronii]
MLELLSVIRWKNIIDGALNPPPIDNLSDFSASSQLGVTTVFFIVSHSPLCQANFSSQIRLGLTCSVTQFPNVVHQRLHLLWGDKYKMYNNKPAIKYNMCIADNNTQRNNFSMERDTWHSLAKSRMKILGITQERLAEKLGVTQGAIGHWLNKRREPSIDMILAILGELGLKNINIGTNGTIVDGHQNTELVPIPASAIRMVPLISWVQAGGFCTTEQPELPADDYEAYACPNPKAGPRTFALKVRGDSMTNAIGGGRSYPEGTIIFVDPDHPASAGQRVVACLEDGGCTFKELAENEMGRQYLRAINPRYTISDHDHPAKICGVVIGSYLPE